MGASLLAIAAGQLTLMLNVPPSSRAGSLPQGLRCSCLSRPKSDLSLTTPPRGRPTLSSNFPEPLVCDDPEP
ncbi:hypothetical protein FPT12_02610 [Pseudomonas sp. H3(2019)]|nr:hypothetical protein FPT12_02610 [Pseudomonas sp. H3(2019)]